MQELKDVLTAQLTRLAAEVAQMEKELASLKHQHKTVKRAIDALKEESENVGEN